MTQKDLFQELQHPVRLTDVDAVIEIINRHVAEVIGEDDKVKDVNFVSGNRWTLTDWRNELRAVQRKRAGLKI